MPPTSPPAMSPPMRPRSPRNHFRHGCPAARQHAPARAGCRPGGTEHAETAPGQEPAPARHRIDGHIRGLAHDDPARPRSGVLHTGSPELPDMYATATGQSQPLKTTDRRIYCVKLTRSGTERDIQRRALDWPMQRAPGPLTSADTVPLGFGMAAPRAALISGLACGHPAAGRRQGHDRRPARRRPGAVHRDRA
jgi:hypothetical protein